MNFPRFPFRGRTAAEVVIPTSPAPPPEWGFVSSLLVLSVHWTNPQTTEKTAISVSPPSGEVGDENGSKVNSSSEVESDSGTGIPVREASPSSVLKQSSTLGTCWNWLGVKTKPDADLLRFIRAGLILSGNWNKNEANEFLSLLGWQ